MLNDSGFFFLYSSSDLSAERDSFLLKFSFRENYSSWITFGNRRVPFDNINCYEQNVSSWNQWTLVLIIPLEMVCLWTRPDRLSCQFSAQEMLLWSWVYFVDINPALELIPRNKNHLFPGQLKLWSYVQIDSWRVSGGWNWFGRRTVGSWFWKKLHVAILKLKQFFVPEIYKKKVWLISFVKLRSCRKILS